MRPDRAFDIPETVVARRVRDEVVILDTASGTYFGLDPVGARIWDLIGEGRTLAEICARMLEEYDVGRETLERDVDLLVGELEGRNLVAAR